MLIVIILIFLIISTSITAYAGGDRLTFSPLPGPINTTGADSQVSFWQLSLFFQITEVLGIVVTFLVGATVALKFAPLLIGKLKKFLANDNRDRIYNYVKQNPGSTMTDISKHEGMNVGTVRYHLEQLRSSHRITLVRSNKFVRFFQNSNTYNDREKIILSALTHSRYRSILLYLRDHPGATNGEIAEHMNISESGAHLQLKRLLQDDLVRQTRDKLAKRYFLSDEVTAQMAKMDNQ